MSYHHNETVSFEMMDEDILPSWCSVHSRSNRTSPCISHKSPILITNLCLWSFSEAKEFSLRKLRLQAYQGPMLHVRKEIPFGTRWMKDCLEFPTARLMLRGNSAPHMSEFCSFIVQSDIPPLCFISAFLEGAVYWFWQFSVHCFQKGLVPWERRRQYRFQ